MTSLSKNQKEEIARLKKEFDRLNPDQFYKRVKDIIGDSNLSEAGWAELDELLPEPERKKMGGGGGKVELILLALILLLVVGGLIIVIISPLDLLPPEIAELRDRVNALTAWHQTLQSDVEMLKTEDAAIRVSIEELNQKTSELEVISPLDGAASKADIVELSNIVKELAERVDYLETGGLIPTFTPEPQLQLTIAGSILAEDADELPVEVGFSRSPDGQEWVEIAPSTSFTSTFTLAAPGSSDAFFYQITITTPPDYWVQDVTVDPNSGWDVTTQTNLSQVTTEAALPLTQVEAVSMQVIVVRQPPTPTPLPPTATPLPTDTPMPIPTPDPCPNPSVKITQPDGQTSLSPGDIEIRGTAPGGYQLNVLEGPTKGIRVNGGDTPKTDDVLGVLTSATVGEYEVRLTASANNGEDDLVCRVRFTISDPASR